MKAAARNAIHIGSPPRSCSEHGESDGADGAAPSRGGLARVTRREDLVAGREHLSTTPPTRAIPACHSTREMRMGGRVVEEGVVTQLAVIRGRDTFHSRTIQPFLLARPRAAAHRARTSRTRKRAPDAAPGGRQPTGPRGAKLSASAAGTGFVARPEALRHGNRDPRFSPAPSCPRSATPTSIAGFGATPCATRRGARAPARRHREAFHRGIALDDRVRPQIVEIVRQRALASAAALPACLLADGGERWISPGWRWSTISSMTPASESACLTRLMSSASAVAAAVDRDTCAVSGRVSGPAGSGITGGSASSPATCSNAFPAASRARARPRVDLTGSVRPRHLAKEQQTHGEPGRPPEEVGLLGVVAAISASVGSLDSASRTTASMRVFTSWFSCARKIQAAVPARRRAGRAARRRWRYRAWSAHRCRDPTPARAPAGQRDAGARDRHCQFTIAAAFRVHGRARPARADHPPARRRSRPIPRTCRAPRRRSSSRARHWVTGWHRRVPGGEKSTKIGDDHACLAGARQRRLWRGNRCSRARSGAVAVLVPGARSVAPFTVAWCRSSDGTHVVDVGASARHEVGIPATTQPWRDRRGSGSPSVGSSMSFERLTLSSLRRIRTTRCDRPPVARRSGCSTSPTHTRSINSCPAAASVSAGQPGLLKAPTARTSKRGGPAQGDLRAHRLPCARPR